jgi:UDP-GlcNAc:undecaprenyl-phosphate/decaprenyl-phosphate GlcNAc-1-phosphate transferase
LPGKKRNDTFNLPSQRDSSYPPQKTELMTRFLHLLQAGLFFKDYKFSLLCFVSAFVVTLICIPPIIALVNRFKLYDIPDSRKQHKIPTPTLGGIAIVAGMLVAMLLWFRFSISDIAIVSFLFCIIILLGMGIMDDLRDLPARYKFIIEIALASLIAFSGIRITGFNGLFGVYELSLSAQYTFTVLALVGITNAFNLIDGIDGLAGGISFMSLVTLGLFLHLQGDGNIALIAFSLAGGILAFLYFNLNPARIFMGDTGSLVIGFVIATLCIRLIQITPVNGTGFTSAAPVFVLGLVLIPVFDTLRVFAVRIWKGRSPFMADRTHIHHLLTNAGISHGMASRIICVVHGFILMEIYWLRNINPHISLLTLLGIMLLVTIAFYKAGAILRLFRSLQRDRKKLEVS